FNENAVFFCRWVKGEVIVHAFALDTGEALWEHNLGLHFENSVPSLKTAATSDHVLIHDSGKCWMIDAHKGELVQKAVFEERIYKVATSNGRFYASFEGELFHLLPDLTREPHLADRHVRYLVAGNGMLYALAHSETQKNVLYTLHSETGEVIREAIIPFMEYLSIGGLHPISGHPNDLILSMERGDIHRRVDLENACFKWRTENKQHFSYEEEGFAPTDVYVGAKGVVLDMFSLARDGDVYVHCDLATGKETKVFRALGTGFSKGQGFAFWADQLFEIGNGTINVYETGESKPKKPPTYVKLID
ncbi:MAG: hypothetical protein AAF570_13110, partial [Bacteroidota bacterium]